MVVSDRGHWLLISTNAAPVLQHDAHLLFSLPPLSLTHTHTQPGEEEEDAPWAEFTTRWQAESGGLMEIIDGLENLSARALLIHRKKRVDQVSLLCVVCLLVCVGVSVRLCVCVCLCAYLHSCVRVYVLVYTDSVSRFVIQAQRSPPFSPLVPPSSC